MNEVALRREAVRGRQAAEPPVKRHGEQSAQDLPHRVEGGGVATLGAGPFGPPAPVVCLWGPEGHGGHWGWARAPSERPWSDDMDPVIRTSGLSKHYGHIVGLESLDLQVPPGIVFGCLGPNGAGKTTAIRLLVGLLRPTHGRAEVLGIDLAADPDEVQRRVGYLPGDFKAYPDLTGAQYLRYLGNLRGGADQQAVERLAKRFELDLSRRIGALSHGNRQKVGIIQAFMSDPQLLILDEPTSGLDPLMQREFLALVREARSAGRTVLLSSHILTEVEAVADMVGILRQGHLATVDSVENLKARALRRIDLIFAHEVPEAMLADVPGVREIYADGMIAQLTVEGSTADLIAALASYRVDDVVSHEADLEEVFLAYYAEKG
jgi:ABC-2 type transport system ATP-binding protein